MFIVDNHSLLIRRFPTPAVIFSLLTWSKCNQCGSGTNAFPNINRRPTCTIAWFSISAFEIRDPYSVIVIFCFVTSPSWHTLDWAFIPFPTLLIENLDSSWLQTQHQVLRYTDISVRFWIARLGNDACQKRGDWKRRLKYMMQFSDSISSKRAYAEWWIPFHCQEYYIDLHSESVVNVLSCTKKERMVSVI